MRITMIAIGSRGDVQPLVALGVGLQACGHDVRIATHATFEALIRSYGLGFAKVVGAPGEGLRSTGWREILDKDQGFSHFARRFNNLLMPYLCQAIADCLPACEDADLILVSQLGIVPGYPVAEKLQVPLVRAFYAPVSPTRAYPAALAPSRLPLGKHYNLWTHHMSRQMVWLLLRSTLNRARTDILDLPPLPLHDPFRSLDKERSPLLYGYSPLLFSRPIDWGKWIHVTGHWFLSRPASWQPPPALVDFLDSGPPPIFIGFGSMSTGNPEETAAMVAQALNRTKQRGVLYTGWGGIKWQSTSDDIFVVGDMPFDWLFPRMAAVIHHGGVGTMHTALRAGVPSTVIPFLPDQRFWGQRLHDVGAGTSPIPRDRLSVSVLTERVQELAQDRVMRHRARMLGERIRAENGVRHAIEVIDSYVRMGAGNRSVNKRESLELQSGRTYP